MKNLLKLSLAFILIFVSCQTESVDPIQESSDLNIEEDLKNSNGPKLKNYRILKMVGRAQGADRPLPEFNGDGIKSGLCFDLELIDVSSNKVVGTGTDCLSNIKQNPDGSVELVGTAFFNFNDGTGSLVTRGLTTVQPTTHGSPGITHITGSIPTANTNSIISGTKDYEKAKGEIRLSGAVTIHSPNQMTFNCVFIVPSRRATRKAKGVDVFRLKGTGDKRVPSRFEKRILKIDNDALCFDVSLLDARNNRRIGRGTDCLSEIVTVGISDDGSPRIKLKGTTIYKLRNGTFASEGLTTVQPTTHGSTGVTHITGAIPNNNNNDSDFIYGNGSYRGIKGKARLSGAVNMSRLDADGKIEFDCVFILNHNR